MSDRRVEDKLSPQVVAVELLVKSSLCTQLSKCRITMNSPLLTQLFHMQCGQEFVQRTAAQKMMQEVLEKLSPAEAV